MAKYLDLDKLMNDANQNLPFGVKAVLNSIEIMNVYTDYDKLSETYIRELTDNGIMGCKKIDPEDYIEEM